MADVAPCRRGSDGLQQLSAAVAYLHHDLLWYGFGLYGTLERYGSYYVVLGVWIFQLIDEPHLAALLSVRPSGMVVAVADLLEAATDAAAGAGSGGRGAAAGRSHLVGR